MTFIIPQTDPKASYLAHKEEIDASINKVLQSSWYILGQQVDDFEREFAAYLGTAHVVGVASGTDAIFLALKVCGVGPGDLVITVSHTAVATVVAIELAGATPVLVDIDPETFTMDPQQLETTIRNLHSNKIPDARGYLKAIIPVHLYGHPADMAAIMDIARRYGLLVIEDCAQSHGASFSGQKTGTFGDLSAFSFYPTKNLGAIGDGGAIATKDAHLAEKARALREYGWHERYISEFPGMNTRLDEVQAAILRVKLRHLNQDNDQRRHLAAVYRDGLVSSGLSLPAVTKEVEHVYHQFVIRSSKRDELRSQLKERKIGTLIHYPYCVHEQAAYKDRVPKSNSLLQSVQAAREILSLPLYPELQEEAVNRVVDAILDLV